MKRLPTLDEIESGHDVDSAALAGDPDAVDVLDAEAMVAAFRVAFPEFP